MTPEELEEQFWRMQVAEGRHGQLDAIRKAATTWSELLAAILGLFGIVAFAGGLTGLEDLESDYQTPIKIATLAAAVLVLAATILAGFAAGYSTQTTSDSSWQGLRDSVNQRAEDARVKLMVAKALGSVAGLIVLVGSATVLLAGEAESTKSPPTVVAVVDGSVVCGKLSAGSGGLQVDGTALSGSVTSIVVVDACP